MRTVHRLIITFFAVLFSGLSTLTLAAQPETARAVMPEAYSLLGQPLYRVEASGDVRTRLEHNLSEALAAYEADPESEEHIIWYGRRLAYLGRYQEAIAVYTRGIELHPKSYKLLRHRGHRFITVRRPSSALADLDRAARLTIEQRDDWEPDGQPNEHNIPRSSNFSNIWYHRAIGYYVYGDYELAMDAFKKSMRRALTNDDQIVAGSYWVYLCLRKMGRDEEAANLLIQMTPDMEIMENTIYFTLLRYFKDEVDQSELLTMTQANDIDRATIGYALGMRAMLEGRADDATEIWHDVLRNSNWAAFGHIAAEAELARLGGYLCAE